MRPFLKRTGPAAFLCALSTAALLLSGCVPFLQNLATEQTASSSESVTEMPAETPEPTEEPEPTGTPSPAEKPETGESLPASVWKALGSEGIRFADGFSAKEIKALNYTFYGEGGAELYATEDPEVIRSAFDAIDGIEITGTTDMTADDFDDVFTFVTAKGEFSVRFNMHNLDAGDFTYYTLDNDKSLWQLANAFIYESEEDALSGEPTDTPEPTEEPAPAVTESPKPTAEPEPTPQTSEEQTAGNWTFTESILASGDIQYCFDGVLYVDLPESWIGRVTWVADGDFFGFYHNASYEKYQEEGYGGGFLFGVEWFADESYTELPSYQYVGKASNGYYVLEFPTDVQAWIDGGEIQEEYFSLYDDIETIQNNAFSTLG